MTVSATLAVNEAIAARRAAGQEVLALGFGEAGIPVHPLLSQRLAQAAPATAYGPVAGIAPAREAAAGYWTRRGLRTDAANVLLGPGSKPLLFALLHAAGGDVVLPKPAWVSYAAQSELLGREPIRVPVPPGEGGVPDAAAMDAAVREARAAGRDPRVVVVTLPDNPTGRLASEASVKAVSEAARELDLLIVADEIYRDLVFETGAPFPSPASWAPERTVTTTALSKNYALGGWRIGAARFPDSELGARLRDSVRGIASELWSSTPMPMQHAAAYAWSDPDVLIDRLAAARRLHGAVAHAVAAVFADVGCAVPAPQGAFYVWPDFAPLREALAESRGVRNGEDLARLLLDEYGVAVLPGSAFGDDPASLTVRVAVPGLYGESDSERLAALVSDEPLEMPWIAASLERLRSKLEALLAE
ncbi:pyridoxal phosphate-dependent aminotransferase [Glycomyces sp. TRM65418]|uniref:pyridoxal phosphate-dependent aminotransferase n=1 Tax=Glycomyces sp. TRM65418 TaxID=2867006 RepID=UPI001CE5469D|nr:pyridoxal phosphate-dependent aminotransferase [Glycomyces sp. TRM65418]MCC3762297.1 pyridoxal phosphate-dependent aminotransferase [Glycomyces sp. TRM65418]QZD56351.1 pyridoxal phosphate-dependent aminotransferase [Glycomyces sp. TRM65418]